MRWRATGLSGDLGTQLQKLFAEQQRAPLLPVNLHEASSGIDTLLHMAARARQHSSWAMFRANILYLRRIVRFAERQHVRRLVFFSTASLYEGSEKTVVSEDDVAITRGDFYAWTKLVGEGIVRNSRIPVRVIVRLPAILENRKNTNFITRAFALIRDGGLPQVWNLDRPFNRLMSASEILRFIDSAEISGTVNLAPQPDHTLRMHLDLMRDHVGCKTPLVEHVSPKHASVIGTQRLQTTYGFIAQDSLEMLRKWMLQRQ
jgi:nucleoside-diphosphate-sugar epimerase